MALPGVPRLEALGLRAGRWADDLGSRAEGSECELNAYGMKALVYGDLTMIYPKPYSIHLRGTLDFRILGFRVTFTLSVMAQSHRSWLSSLNPKA